MRLQCRFNYTQHCLEFWKAFGVTSLMGIYVMAGGGSTALGHIWSWLLLLWGCYDPLSLTMAWDVASF